MNEKRQQIFQVCCRLYKEGKIYFQKFVQSGGFCPGTGRGTFMPLES